MFGKKKMPLVIDRDREGEEEDSFQKEACFSPGAEIMLLQQAISRFAINVCQIKS